MTTVGGQAVLEGVMMRGPSNWAVAVRKPDGDIAQVHQPIRSPMARHWVFRIPVVRGVVALGESLAIGFRALAISANYAAQEPREDGVDPEEVSTELTRGQLIFAFAIAYELIRFAGKHQQNRILMTVLAPGLWLQRLTTREPTLDQLEVSIRALKEVLSLESRAPTDARKVEVMA